MEENRIDVMQLMEACLKEEVERATKQREFERELYESQKVKCWLSVGNPVRGTCRRCGHRGLVDDAIIGLYLKEGRE